jgi:hypothetical protein
MKFYIRCTILPLWDTPAKGTDEARKRGDLRVEFLKLAQEFEAKIIEAVEERK